MCQTRLNDAPQMGGIGEIVQIDESLFRGKRKYHRGRLLLGNSRNQTTAANNNNSNDLVLDSSLSSSDGSDSKDDLAETNNNRNYGKRIDGEIFKSTG